jgi:hypothetical protein
MGKAQRLEDLLVELAFYEATVSNWGVPGNMVERVVAEG